jgi:hypothetical protein
MRSLLLAGLLSASVLVPQSSQAAENWCARNLGEGAGKPCVTAPLDYCMRGIRLGGVCAREGYVGNEGSREPAQRPSQRSGARERGDRAGYWR